MTFGNFESPQHAMFTGWVLGLARNHGITFTPVMDGDDYTPDFVLVLDAEDGHNESVTLTITVPPPPPDWRCL